MRLIELTLSKDKLQLFGFLSRSPTKALKKGNFIKLLYYEPTGTLLLSFDYKGLTVKLHHEDPTEHDFNHGWQLIRDYPITTASADLLVILEDLEALKLNQARTGTGLVLEGWIFEVMTTGIFTKKETSQLVKTMFLAGYDMEQVINLFTSLVRRQDLARYFIELTHHLYIKGVERG